MTIVPEQAPRRGRPARSRLVVLAVVLVAAVVAVVVVVTSRGGGAKHPAGPSALVRHAARTHAASTAVSTRGWRVPLHAVTQPAPVAGRFVVYASKGGTLQLVALDAKTGRTAWTRPASPSSIAPGVAPIVTVVGRTVVYLEGNGSGSASIVAADAATGVTAWRSPSGDFSTWPTVCPDDRKVICASGHVSGGPDGAELRLDAATGELLPTAQVGGAGGRAVGSDLYDIGQRDPEVLLATSGSSAMWQQPLQRIFTFRGASTDWGWNFDRIPRLGLYVGSVGARPLVQSSTLFVSDLAGGMTAGFRMRDGKVVWRAPNTQYMCGYFTCAGADNTSFSSADAPTSGGPTVGIRIRAHGQVSGSPDSVTPRLSKDATAVLEGFDPATGRVRWRFDLGHNAGVLSETALPPRISATKIALPDKHGRLVVLDLATGATTRASATTAAMCSSVINYHMDAGYQTTARTIHEYVGGFALTPCTATGRSVARPTRATPVMSGVVNTLPGVAAWTDKNDVVAVPAV